MATRVFTYQSKAYSQDGKITEEKITLRPSCSSNFCTSFVIVFLHNFILPLPIFIFLTLDERIYTVCNIPPHTTTSTPFLRILNTYVKILLIPDVKLSCNNTFFHFFFFFCQPALARTFDAVKELFSLFFSTTCPSPSLSPSWLSVQFFSLFKKESEK